MRSDDLPLSRALADRAAELRARPGALSDALADESTRVVVVHDGDLLTASDGRLELLDVAAARALAPAGGLGAGTREQTDEPTDELADALDGRWLLLGRHDGTTFLGLRLPAHDPAPLVGRPADVLVHQARPRHAPQPPGWVSLRRTGAALSPLDAGLATAAVALDAWHTRHPRCPRCGAPTTSTQAGWVRRCTQDGSEHYPRTDPAVIMAVVDADDRLLLGHARAWEAHRFSTLAGFVEPGESLEHAVRREVLEEVGVVVGDVQYRGSQPWPFPASLMVGFVAHASSTALTPDGDELEGARWFTRDELAAAVREGDVIPPGPSSIARALVEDWFGGALPAPRA
ncbi:NAD(+) diphosphatase [Cellulomonas sp. HZM]|uniref:NAD(+) diphosphatase n=1 Tax=Cellulomonas sp. HZM TaxID=1454010 RepID=UPI000492EE7C|nr:NAD(+) diphosphatase [Cellulomonas sp. HZM]